ncbi:hypothetical protein GOBAR_AA08289 [Gossypium barbadense]|uniref:Uncharacterized protein n=1 Tax=Gossypium barbadense TaxID=3634 RepID=A0A2P5Y9V6_GOSBA|nr:hypothetical protein GOBAR_AA08289 [Gossypium barbadense]
MDEPVNLARVFNTPVPSPRGRHCQTNTGVGYHTRAWEKRTKQEVWGECQTYLNLKIVKHTDVPHGYVPQNLYKPLTIHHPPPQKSLTLAAATPHGLPATPMADAVRALLTTEPWGIFFEIIEPTYLEFTMELCSTFYLQVVMTNFNDPGTVHELEHFGLLNTVAQSSSFTLIGQMSPQGISSMLNMRMIKKRRGTYPPQYHLVQSTEEEDLEGITNDVPPCHEDPPSQPPPIHRPVHTAASLSNISERLT